MLLHEYQAYLRFKWAVNYRRLVCRLVGSAIVGFSDGVQQSIPVQLTVCEAMHTGFGASIADAHKPPARLEQPADRNGFE